ncbi:UvrD-helicase domain-containing protein [Phototrophicus methaneseepsis]|uniref:DNA 3'-5' helicase n=1 Tax=Phototrophicus methaneseepsis TaxID=2710758 RepID=A0A7S8E8V4_9CHLR|nr:UvrD-helicase domain-containing protein [Phototrophicus methaneseepsis]QPC82507.1 UvrD-helicase domain-containing protein [Phototrophicus methaneseepsis]
MSDHPTGDLLAGLNDRQRAAVTAGGGPILVLAGPGSGKTRVLTRRIAYLINEMNIPARSIMAVTFTNKAAGEMRNRLKSLAGDRMRAVQIGTFHATCARILRIEHDSTPYGKDFVIYDTDDQLNAIGQAMSELNIDTRKFNPRAVLGAISSAKNELILPSGYVGQDYFGEIVSRVYPRYQAILLDSNAMDFDDLLVQMVLALHHSPVLQEKYQRKFAWVLVDEFQDTNTVQYQLVSLFGAPQNNIFVVGDEDQSIYAFRGADYRNVARFRQDYPDASVILLEQNYRSTQVVLDVANAVISRNKHRTPKALFTDKAGGELITLHEAYDDEYEARYVMEEIDDLRRRGYHYSDMAVMYRTNPQSRALERACVDEGIPYTLVGGVGFYKRREIRDMLAYLRVVQNPDDRVSFARIINTPKRGIGKKSLESFQYWAADAEMSYGEALIKLLEGADNPLGARAAKLFRDFAEQLFAWRSLTEASTLVDLFDTISSDVGYNLYLHEISDNDLEAADRMDNLSELRGLLVQADEDEINLPEFLIDQALMTDADTKLTGEDRITLMTLHAAKGLEYPVVFITGLEDGLLPHFRSFDEPDGVEEERRLLYVGITRAMERLYLTYAFKRTTWSGSQAQERSSFLYDIPEDMTAGLPSGLNTDRSYQSYKQMTTWGNTRAAQDTERRNATSGLDRLRRDLQRGSATSNSGNKAVNSKIIPFPGSEPQPPAEPQFHTGMSVYHSVFGAGMVVESHVNQDDEEVTVVFSDKRYGVKKLLASLANLTVQ